MELRLLPKIEIERTEIEGKRHYITPDGTFPSVTTVIGDYYDKTFLDSWKKRIGEVEAERISNSAALAGTKLHNVLEKFLLNEDYSSCHSIDKLRFESVKRKIKDHIKVVYGSEYFLYSKRLGTAGASDGAVKWDNDYAIIDLKTTKTYKSEEYIENYFVQAAAYGIMLNELLAEWNNPIRFNKLIIIFSTSDFNSYYFEKNISDYEPLVNKIFIGNK